MATLTTSNTIQMLPANLMLQVRSLLWVVISIVITTRWSGDDRPSSRRLNALILQMYSFFCSLWLLLAGSRARTMLQLLTGALPIILFAYTTRWADTLTLFIHLLLCKNAVSYFVAGIKAMSDTMAIKTFYWIHLYKKPYFVTSDVVSTVYHGDQQSSLGN